MSETMPAVVEPAPKGLDRLLLARPRLTLEGALWAALLLSAAALRLWDLGSRALHHDESLHALYSWYLASGLGYRHDPLMHGPFQFHGIALIFLLLRDSDATARLLAASFGIGGVALASLFRPYLGRLGALAAGLMLTFSPGMLYFSRFARNDIIVVAWNLLWVWALWRYRDTGRARFLLLGTAAMGLSFATKETAYITFALLMLYLLVTRALELLRWVRSRFVRELSPAAQALWTWGALALPFFSASLSPLLRPRGLSASWPPAFASPLDPALLVPALVVISLLWVSAVLGLMARPRLWLQAALLFWGIEVVLYTTFFTNPGGFASGLWGSLDYWLQQQGIRRGGQPWYYYLLLLSLYEFLPLLLSSIALPLALRRGDSFGRFLVYWALGSFALYTYAGEKMPWLSLHLTLPLILLAAWLVGRFAQDGVLRLSKEGWPPLGLAPRAAVGGTLLLLLGFTAFNAVRAAFIHGDVPREMLIYTQTSADVPALVRRVEQMGWESGRGVSVPITVDGHNGFTWPWAWYLRHYTRVSYPPNLTEALKDQMVVLAHAANAPALEAQMAGYERVPYRLRAWFPEVYRGLTLRRFWDGLWSPDARRQVWEYFLTRRLPEPLGSEDGVAYLAPSAP